MTSVEFGQILGSIATFVGSLAAVYVSVRNSGKIDVNTAKVDQVGAAQEVTHKTLAAVVETVAGVQENVTKVEVATNHMKDALVEATAHANLLQGRNEGIAQEKDRAAAAEAPPQTST